MTFRIFIFDFLFLETKTSFKRVLISLLKFLFFSMSSFCKTFLIFPPLKEFSSFFRYICYSTSCRTSCQRNQNS
ncbi:hypothetical protein PRV_01150 [Mycoplasma parvum str. Indiana]|uniref:Uncharacterized protein n=1 Tax=Mycoplasma parvum str. Indiana TaxID=1403316 RepID=U5NC53_9MOLU|nr:hypothetical protein PRV_01150 [Mycoplasma parvum str. Indiana]